ncbi:MAG: alpha/beta hydrolase [Candidatus Micrarchaeota archaeon]
MINFPAIVFAVLVAVILSGCISETPEKPFYSLDAQGRLSYTGRAPVQANVTPIWSDVPGTSAFKVLFAGRNSTIAGLLWVPEAGDEKKPAFVFLPGAGVGKEVGKAYAGLLAPYGISVFSLDQRGFGESGGVIASMDDDFSVFQSGGEPSQYLYFHDALLAFDYLRSRPDVNPSSIVVAGESMGGRAALVAGGIEPGVRGVLGISTSGYGRPQMEDANASLFIRSVDPDSYVLAISPRQVAFIHSAQDRAVPIADARRSFNLAGQPKRLYEVNCTNHGYCSEMDAAIVESVRGMLGLS